MCILATLPSRLQRGFRTSSVGKSPRQPWLRFPSSRLAYIARVGEPRAATGVSTMLLYEDREISSFAQGWRTVHSVHTPESSVRAPFTRRSRSAPSRHSLYFFPSSSARDRHALKVAPQTTDEARDRSRSFLYCAYIRSSSFRLLPLLVLVFHVLFVRCVRCVALLRPLRRRPRLRPSYLRLTTTK